MKEAYKKRVLLGMLLLVQFAVYPQDSSLLWEISGNGMEKKSYLYGTIHLKDKRVFQFGDSVMIFFHRCDAFAGELLLDGNFGSNLLSKVMMPGDTTLKDLISKKDYKKVKKYARNNLGFMALFINKVKPVFISGLITEQMSGGEMSKTLDEYLQELAKKREKNVYGLETMDEQIAALDDWSLQEQAQMLVEQVSDIKGQKAATEEMIRLYLQEDLDSLFYFVDGAMPSEEFNESILVKRNYVMMERMMPIMSKESVFVAVGAAHLPGKEGLIKLLQDEGYTVRPVFSSSKKK